MLKINQHYYNITAALCLSMKYCSGDKLETSDIAHNLSSISDYFSATAGADCDSSKIINKFELSENNRQSNVSMNTSTFIQQVLDSKTQKEYKPSRPSYSLFFTPGWRNW